MASSFILLFYVLSFIRWETGTDWESYYAMFSWIKVPFSGVDPNIEFGYWFLNNLSKEIVDSYTFALCVFATVLYGFFYRGIYTLSPYLIFTLFISFCLGFAHIFFVRQNIAICIALYSILHIKERRFFLFILFLFLAFLFHRSALIFLFAYWLWNKSFQTKILIIYIFVGVVIGVLFFKDLVAFLAQFANTAFSSRVYKYLEIGTGDNSMAFSTTTLILKGFINRFFLFSLILYFLNKKRKTDSVLNGLINLYAAGIVIYVVTLPISISFARLAIYYDLTQILIVPYIFKTISSRNVKTVIFLFLSLYYLTRLYSSAFAYYDAFVPYKTIFD